MPNPWIKHLIESVSGSWGWHRLPLHIGFQYREPKDADDCWEVWAYPAVQEIVGGKDDGETGWCGFNFDVTGFLEGFEAKGLTVSARMGQAPPELVVEGEFRDKPILLHVCLEPLDDVQTSEIIDLAGPGGPSVGKKG
jgi:hypothetical protein